LHGRRILQNSRNRLSHPQLASFCPIRELALFRTIRPRPWPLRSRPTRQGPKLALFRAHVESTITLFPPGACPSYRRCRIGFVSHVQSPVPIARATEIGFVSRSGASRRCRTIGSDRDGGTIRQQNGGVSHAGIGFVLHMLPSAGLGRWATGQASRHNSVSNPQSEVRNQDIVSVTL
jgi:hypothetical protein